MAGHDLPLGTLIPRWMTGSLLIFRTEAELRALPPDRYLRELRPEEVAAGERRLERLLLGSDAPRVQAWLRDEAAGRTIAVWMDVL